MKKMLLKSPEDAPQKSVAPMVGVRIRKILTTTDFSNESVAGVRFGVALAEKVRAAITLLHVVEIPPPPPMPGMRIVTQTLQGAKIAKRVRARLMTLAYRESKGDVSLTPLLRSGNSFYAIITTAREIAADVIVIATHGYAGIKRVLLGSTAERVVRHAPCPVLTVPSRTTPGHMGKLRPMNLKRILVPIDFSKTSETALPWAFSLAGECKELVLLHVVQKFPIDYVLEQESLNETVKPLMKQSEAELRQLAENLSKRTGLKTSVVVRYGKPFKVICSVAQKLGVDLITLTTHGYTGLKQLWLGSTAERVVRHAPCPVLVVRELKKS